MTHQKQQDFMERLEAALLWMQASQEILKANDNTRGPFDALEARLRETEKIHQSEHEGRVKMDMALVAAEKLLENGDEELRKHTLAKLKSLKSQWEETSTYIIHCHSRIEWVWLHWSEYLKAYEEFELWLTRQQRILNAGVELQLGLKEKIWQVDHQRVIVSDIHGQAVLLERLLNEAAALHNRTQDHSVEPQTQNRLQEAYKEVQERAEERLLLLQKIAEDHQTYQGRIQGFQSWLLSKTKELTDLMDSENTTEIKLKALQALDDSVAGEKNNLQHIEGVAEAVRSSTSPAGVEVVVEEAEELRLGWQRLRQGLCEAEEGLRLRLDSYGHYMANCQQLGEDIGRLRQLLQGLNQELVEGCEIEDCTEEQIVGQWRKYKGVKKTLAREESQVELLKSQLKELFKFSVDSRQVSDDVLAVVKEHQSVKSRATRLCSELQSGLRNILQDPLLVYTQWSHMVPQVLEASAEVTDFSHIDMIVQNIERLLKDGVQLQEHFSLLHVKGDLLDSVFGHERSDALQGELGAAIKNRELLHTQLLQRKSRLQALISRTKDFGDAYKLIHAKLAYLQDTLVVADGLHPDILAKKSQLDQYRMIQRDLVDCEVHITALEILVSSVQSNRTNFERLYNDWKHLQKAVRTKLHESEESVAVHESFHGSLLNIEKWLMIMKQKLKSFHSSAGEWSIEGRQHEAERALGEFPEKEIQLQQMEVQGQRVLETTSEEGQIHILQDMKRLRKSWLSLYNMSLNLHRLLNSSMELTAWKDRALSVDSSFLTELSLGQDDSEFLAGGSRSQRGKKQDQSTETFGAFVSPGSGQGDSLEGEAGEGLLTGRSEWIQGHAEGQFMLAAEDDEHFTPSRTEKDSQHSFNGDEIDSLDLSIHCSQGVPKDTAEWPDNKSTGNDNHILIGDRGVAALTAMGNTGHCKSRRNEFEAWLCKGNKLLSGILSTKRATLSAKELKIQQNTLEALQAGVVWGQEQFELLLKEKQCRVSGSDSAEDVGLEEIRYNWMLYKSKLKDVGDMRARSNAKKPGLLQRVCRLAFILWIPLLALLLLLFLLPLMDEGNSCSFSNNFARSFNIMLRYDGPPPT
ncbi:nesprin-3 isoform X2 [Platichthys flesus]|uniref:nesprin-3 isoform X2 n=1 Tax=Platichthys flesus TaxID=8260 RepID=UPI002DB807FC|nr:nesprin-3 isoform X2 [Platichthys flesus]